MAKDKGTPAAKGKATGHEDRDISIIGVAQWIGLVLGTVLLVMLICYTVYRFKPSHGEGDLVLSRKMSQPALQPRPDDDMDNFLAQEQKQLTTYGWVDKNAGVVHIPIERAMDLVLQKGFPVRSTR